MKVFPREHGATVIWFASILTTFLTIPIYPSIPNILIFLAVSFAILIFIAQITNLSLTLIHVQLNSLILPIITGFLTSITLLGYYIMVGTVSAKNLSIWLLLLTFTIISVNLVQREVQRLLRMKEYSTSHIVILGLTIFSVEIIMVTSSKLMHSSIVLSIAPLISLWIYLKRNHIAKTNTDSKVKKIREIGFFQTWNIIIFVLILAILSRL